MSNPEWRASLMESLQSKYGQDRYSLTSAAVDIVIHALAYASADEWVKGKPYRPDRMGTKDWTDNDIFRLADITFNIYKIASDLRIDNYPFVAREYAAAVVNNDETLPKNLVSKFQEKSFTTADGRTITGKEILAEAIRQRRTPPAQQGGISP